MRREPPFFSRKRTLYCRMAAGVAVCSLLAGTLTASGIDRSIGKEKEKALSFDTVYRNPKSRIERDASYQIFAQEYKGALLDLTSRYAVIDSWRGKSFIPLSEVTRIERAGDAKAIERFEEHRKHARAREDWVKLEKYARENGLVPERRACIRKLLEKDSSNREYRLFLGEAQAGGEWLREAEVATRLDRGYRLVKGRLEKKPEVKKKKKSDFWKRPPSKKIRTINHLKLALERKSAHSLWMLVSRSGLFALPTSKPPQLFPNLQTTQDLIDLIDSRGNYQWRLKTFLAERGIPIDWSVINLNKAGSFKKRHPGSIHHETKYYHILSTCGEATVKELGRKMDIVTEQIYQDLFKFAEKIPYKYILRFYRNAGEYQKNGGSPTTTAHYVVPLKELVGYKPSSREARGRDPFYALYHEGWHQYFDFYIPNAPRWFDEGFAEVISPLIIKGNKAKMNTFNAGRSNVLKAYLNKRRIIPLGQLIRLNALQFHQPDVVGLAYAQSWSFVHFLINFKHPKPGIQKKVRAFYKDYFWELHKGTDPVEACDIVFKDVQFHTLEKAWLKSIHKQK